MTGNQQVNFENHKLPATSGQRKMGGALFLVVVLSVGSVAVLEAMQYDIGQVFLPCGFKVNHGLPCPTCGYTTSLRAFATGHVVSAFVSQPAACLIYLSLVVSAIVGGYVAVSGHMPNWLRRGLRDCRPKHVFLGLVLVILSGWGAKLAQAFSQK